ncbi:hypothetical protein [Actinocrispum wychmicini]|uniref:Uncharacterized protein n=1 Tax=Actinocrispum wychmicini TaxID=1213861 RepID=A0A4R2JFL2_9PSEU|nr:hypothetical protein [Actinocrispum wychmicini]TCO55648.1 hypothetical protein EV192_10770 [Actinocrispum wychmicini]
MAGSYEHVVADDGQLLVNKDFVEMVEHLGGAYETVEHMYGMVWWHANRLAAEHKTDPASLIKAAAANYKVGLEVSPGTAGTLPEEQ